MAETKIYMREGCYTTTPALVAAKYKKVTVEKIDTDANIGATESGLSGLPTLVTKSGEHFVGPFAVAHHLAPESLRGQDHASILEWLWLAEAELSPAIVQLVHPCLGLSQPNTKAQQHSKESVVSILTRLNSFLETRTFLVGQRLSLADIFVAAYLAPLFQYSIEASVRAPFGNVLRWFNTVTGQKQWRDAVGAPVLCEKAAAFDSKKFAELQAKTKPAGGEKQEKKEKQQPAKKEEKKKEEKKEEEAKENEEDDENKEVERPDPFSALPKSTKFAMDDWKRTYSNNDVNAVALPWFWEHFDPECYSVWLCEYMPQYQKHLKFTFMTSNLIGGMYQRLEKMMRNAFSVMGIFGVDNDNTIVGVWLWKGKDLAFTLDTDWQTDYESYNWTKLDHASEETKTLVTNFWGQKAGFEYKGRTLNAIKVLK